MNKDEFISRFVGWLESTASFMSQEEMIDMAETNYEQWDGIDTPEEMVQEEFSRWGD